MEKDAEGVADVVGAELLEALGAVAALEDESPAQGGLGEDDVWIDLSTASSSCWSCSAFFAFQLSTAGPLPRGRRRLLLQRCHSGRPGRSLCSSTDRQRWMMPAGRRVRLPSFLAAFSLAVRPRHKPKLLPPLLTKVDVDRLLHHSSSRLIHEWEAS
ncbi:hypothetical protein EJB05_03159 [Eragrostis curvula]|uniref:Uncharacterized protein n=1 Tax=Eragrostis curvula TaxID=38414 RepID=A0A5J9WUZ1_9POAL|nr:hypothetical protein EJB05_03159 [Eragrostis curvula]